MDLPLSPPRGTHAARLAAAVGLLDAAEIDAAEQAALSLCADDPHAGAGFVLLARCADARGERALAQQRWLDCAARFPAEPARWRVGLAYSHFHTDRLAEAAVLFGAALAADPRNPAALAGRALVLSRTAPVEAEAAWHALFAVTGGPPKAGWQVNRSKALAESGQVAQAIAVLDQALADTPGYRPAVVMRAKLLKAPTTAAAGAEPGRDEASGTVEHLNLARRQRVAGNLAGARASLLAALEAAHTAGTLSAVLETMPNLFAAYERGQTWRLLRARAIGLLPPEAAPTLCLQMRLDIALRDFDSFLRRWAGSPPQPEPWGRRFARLAATLQAPVFPDFAAPKIFGIGVSKSGTSSLARALDRLGYLHAHFRNPFSGEFLQEADFVLFDGASDSPVTARLEMLYAQFPNARFILTERPKDSWLRSFRQHFDRWEGRDDAPFREHSYATLKETLWGVERTLVDAVLYRPYADAVAARDAHIDRVERFFADRPTARVLRHSVFRGDGWAELCAFLDQPVPEDPYPWDNQAPSPA